MVFMGEKKSHIQLVELAFNSLEQGDFSAL